MPQKLDFFLFVYISLVFCELSYLCYWFIDLILLFDLNCWHAMSVIDWVLSFNCLHHLNFNHLVSYTGVFKMTVGVLATCHAQYTWDRSKCIFLCNRTTLQVFVTYLTGALYVHPLWFYKHQHDNRVRSKLFCSMLAVMVSVAVVIRTFSFGILAGRVGT